MGGYLGSPLSWDPSTESKEGSRHFLKGDRCCSALASPCHTSHLACPQPCPPAPSSSHTKLLPQGSPRAFSPLYLLRCPPHQTEGEPVHLCIHPRELLQDAEVERPRQAMRVSECPLSAVQDTWGQECVPLSFVSQIPSPQFMGVGLKSRLQKLPRLTGRQCSQSQMWL